MDPKPVNNSGLFISFIFIALPLRAALISSGLICLSLGIIDTVLCSLEELISCCKGNRWFINILVNSLELTKPLPLRTNPVAVASLSTSVSSSNDSLSLFFHSCCTMEGTTPSANCVVSKNLYNSSGFTLPLEAPFKISFIGPFRASTAVSLPIVAVLEKCKSGWSPKLLESLTKPLPDFLLPGKPSTIALNSCSDKSSPLSNWLNKYSSPSSPFVAHPSWTIPVPSPSLGAMALIKSVKPLFLANLLTLLGVFILRSFSSEVILSLKKGPFLVKLSLSVGLIKGTTLLSLSLL